MKIKLMIASLLTVLGLQGSLIEFQGIQPQLKRALWKVVQNTQYKDKKLARAIHYFEPVDNPVDNKELLRKMPEQIKQVIEEVGGDIDEKLRQYYGFINMISSEDLSQVDEFNVLTGKWRTRWEIENLEECKYQGIMVFAIFKGDDADVARVKGLIDNGVPLLINMSSSKDDYDIRKILGDDVAVFGDVREKGADVQRQPFENIHNDNLTQEGQAVVTPAEAIATDESLLKTMPVAVSAIHSSDQSNGNSQVQSYTSLLKAVPILVPVVKPSDKSGGNPQVQSSRRYWIIGGFTVAAFFAFLYHKYGHMLTMNIR